MTCKTCGRREADGGGHWLACPEIPGSLRPMKELVQTVEQCEIEGCDNLKYSDHPRVKYCEEHRDPKNRKE